MAATCWPRLLMVHPGADWSTADVWRGLSSALQRAGVEVVQYALNKRLAYWQEFMDGLWRKSRKTDRPLPRPTQGDVMYQAGVGILERALRHRVDWVFVITGEFILPQTYELMRRAGLRVAVLLTESPYDDALERDIARYADVIFTNERTSVKTFADITEAHYLPHAYDPERHGAGAADESVALAHDVVFVGTGFIERLRLLEAIDWTGIDLGLYGAFDLWGSRNRMRRFIRANIVDNAHTAALYRKAKVGLNLHRTSKQFGRNVEHIAYAESMNPRCYELAAAGCFFISDARAEVKEVFGDLVPTFRSPKEAEELIHYYLTHEDERHALASRLPGAVAAHTFDDRAKRILEILAAKRQKE